MNNQFCNYENSKELKELGFNEPCFGRWLIITKWEVPTGEIRLQLGVEVECYDKNQCIALLHSQAINFLLEKLPPHYEVGQNNYQSRLYYYNIGNWETFTTKDELISHMIKLVKNESSN